MKCKYCKENFNIRNRYIPVKCPLCKHPVDENRRIEVCKKHGWVTDKTNPVYKLNEKCEHCKKEIATAIKFGKYICRKCIGDKK